MADINHILQLIKNSVNDTEPNSTLILYGSYSRGDYNKDSDIDILVLVDKEKLSDSDEDKITFPLYSIGIQTDTLISPFVYTKKAWQNHRVTPFYENVIHEGKIL